MAQWVKALVTNPCGGRREPVPTGCSLISTRMLWATCVHTHVQAYMHACMHAHMHKIKFKSKNLELCLFPPPLLHSCLLWWQLWTGSCRNNVLQEEGPLPRQGGDWEDRGAESATAWLEPDLDTLPYQKSFELVQVKTQPVVTDVWQLKHRIYI